MATRKKSTKKAAKPKIEEKAEVQPAEQVMEAKTIPDEAEMQEKFAAAIDELRDPGNGKSEVPAFAPKLSISQPEADEIADQIEWGLRSAKVVRPHRGYELVDFLRGVSS